MTTNNQSQPDMRNLNEPNPVGSDEDSQSRWKLRLQSTCQEVRQIAIVTFHHIRCWTTAVWVEGHRRVCLWQVNRQKALVGEQMHVEGVGDSELRRQLWGLEDAIQQAKTEKQPVRHHLRSRRVLLLQLADSLPTAPDGASVPGAEKMQSLQRRITELESAQQTRETSERTPKQWMRVGVGYGVLMLLIAFGIGGLLAGSPNQSYDKKGGPSIQVAQPNEPSPEGTTPDSVEPDEHNVKLVSEEVADAANGKMDETNEPTPVPPKNLTALDGNDDLPSTGLFGVPDEAIVDLVTKPTSFKYLQAGFKEFQFGASSDTIKSLAAENKVPLREGRQNFFIEDGKLIGYQRLYRDDNEGYLRQFREIFGGALKDDISEALATRQGSTMDMRANSVATADREETMLVRYYFPDSIAYLQAAWRASAQANINSVFRREYLLFNIFDHIWVDALLSEHVSDCRDALEWVRQLVADENAGLLKLSEVLDYPGAKREYEAPPKDASVETLKLLDERGEAFIVIERALKELYDRPKGSISIGIHFGAMPEKTNPIYKYMFLAIEIDRCNALVAQEVFPPRGTTIETVKRRDSHQKSFIWRTSDDLKITVSPGNHIYLTNIPEKGL